VKTFRFLLAVLTLAGGAACTDMSPAAPTPVDAPLLDTGPTECKAGGYVGSDGKWVCY
jgi:hypothetical protein